MYSMKQLSGNLVSIVPIHNILCLTASAVIQRSFAQRGHKSLYCKHQTTIQLFYRHQPQLPYRTLLITCCWLFVSILSFFESGLQNTQSHVSDHVSLNNYPKDSSVSFIVVTGFTSTKFYYQIMAIIQVITLTDIFKNKFVHSD